jgi:geranylgeranyl pyrophosphate synthase
MLRLIYHTILGRVVEEINAGLLVEPFREPDLNRMYVAAVSRGRRSRALLVLAGCEAVGGQRRAAMPMALAMELVHKASLIVDDVVDRDLLRRGQPSFHARYGLRKAVVMADLLTSLAYQHLTKLECSVEPHVVAACYYLVSDTYRTMCLGAIQELLLEKRGMSEDKALDVALKKSGVMTENCLRTGGMLGRGREVEISALGTFGRSIGLAFQLINDLNSIEDVEEQAGRPLGSDLRIGRMNFLAVYALRRGNAADRSRLAQLLVAGELETAQIQEAIRILHRSGAVGAAKDQIHLLLEEARTSVDPLRPSIVKKLFARVIDNAEDPWLWMS